MTIKGTLVICRSSAYMMENPQIIVLKALEGCHILSAARHYICGLALVECMNKAMQNGSQGLPR